MGRIAVDIVLLPDEAMTQQAIRINRALVGEHRAEILGPRTCLPHISLAMGIIEEIDVDVIRQLLERLARETAVHQLTILGVESSTNTQGQTVILLAVERTPALQDLHERVMRETEPLFGHDATEDMIADEIVAPSTLEWIRNYPTQASFDRFAPHITIGYGRVEAGVSFPYPFVVERLALCHLGNHCTCRKVLAAAYLPGSANALRAQ